MCVTRVLELDDRDRILIILKSGKRDLARVFRVFGGAAVFAGTAAHANRLAEIELGLSPASGFLDTGSRLTSRKDPSACVAFE